MGVLVLVTILYKQFFLFQLTLDEEARAYARNFYSKYQPKEHLLTETVSSPCLDAALSERPSQKNPSRLAEFNTKMKLNSLKQQREAEAKSTSVVGSAKAGSLSNYKNLSLPQLRQIYLNAQARLHHKQLQPGQPQLNTGSAYSCVSPDQLQSDGKLEENTYSNESSPLSSKLSINTCPSGRTTRASHGAFSSNQNVQSASPTPLSPLTSEIGSPDQFSVKNDIVSSSAAGAGANNLDSPLPQFNSPTCMPSSPEYASSDNSGHSNPLKMKSFGLKSNPEMKKYRYNQTALALHQSGLMKTTMKTAELLRKSHLLQQELAKLKKETVSFVSSVLNNPENKHLKEMYSHLLWKNSPGSNYSDANSP